ncbi:hypothetical protein SASPL_125670 [Salvia splendens]|uniref:SET domain-containing protein n=1 Tax=Salvia splendens TaxID=180675 RepID=A0A8X8XFW3_SALSN|nr:uncharacterized protein LOC121746960 [Salvia splendens]XP_041996863.1 uncharacterized protein LOC121746960 [Salvia splendens]KAG6412975.1 hypothetical protein SASPL_125670 [Salvia splendens]
MAFLFQKFQEAVKVLAKSPTFAKQGRQLQFEADMNKLFLFTSYNRLGKNAEEADADEIIEMASKANLEEQQKQVQENIHEQISTFCKYMDDILRPDPRMSNTPNSSPEAKTAPRRSGLGLAVGRTTPMDRNPSMAVPETKMIKRCEVSQNLKDLLDYTLEIKPSQIQHKDAGQGLFLDGEADVGAVIAFYPGITYSPAYYRYIPGYPRVDLENPYLITRYDGTVINAQPWGTGGEARELWNGSGSPQAGLNAEGGLDGSDRMWKLLSKPLDGSKAGGTGAVLERRHPLAFAHFANHPSKDLFPNVMVCPYDFPLTEQNMRTYIPNVPFGGGQEVSMKKFGTFWFKSWKSSSTVADVPVIRSLVLVATRAISNEEILLNYRLSNAKRRPSWYTPVDEDEDRRRWS